VYVWVCEELLGTGTWEMVGLPKTLSWNERKPNFVFIREKKGDSEKHYEIAFRVFVRFELIEWVFCWKSGLYVHRHFMCDARKHMTAECAVRS